MDWIEFVHVGLIYINRLALYIFIRFLKHTLFHLADKSLNLLALT